jgi:hypothetical protein
MLSGLSNRVNLHILNRRKSKYVKIHKLNKTKILSKDLRVISSPLGIRGNSRVRNKSNLWM